MNTIIDSKPYTNSLERMCGCGLKLFLQNRKGNITSLIAYFGFWLVVGIFTGYNEVDRPTADFLFYWIAASFCCGVMASYTFKDMITKEGRINLLLQPATTFEKFIPRLIFAFILPIIIVISGYLILESARILTIAAVYGEWSGYNISFNSFFSESPMSICGCITWYILGQSYYFMGSILWPKLSYIKSLGLCIAIYIAFLTIFTVIIANNVVLRSIIVNNMINYESAGWIAIIISMLVSAGFIAIAYIRLKKSSIIKRL